METTRVYSEMPQMDLSVKFVSKSTTVNVKVQLTSNLVVYCLAKEKVPYTYGENRILHQLLI